TLQPMLAVYDVAIRIHFHAPFLHSRRSLRRFVLLRHTMLSGSIWSLFLKGSYFSLFFLNKSLFSNAAIRFSVLPASGASAPDKCARWRRSLPTSVRSDPRCAGAVGFRSVPAPSDTAFRRSDSFPQSKRLRHF